MSTVRKFISAVLHSGKVGEWAQGGSIDYLFKNIELPYFEFVETHVRKHGVLPHPDTFELHTGAELPEASEPASYYRELLFDRYVELELKSLTKQAGEYLTLDNKKPRKALDTMVEGIAKIRVRENSAQISSFKDAYDLVMPEYLAQATKGDETGIRLGWPYLDEMTGGLYVGDKVSIVGRPATGKTYSLLYNGLSTWHKQQRTVLFISMEIKPLLIHQRLAAMHAHVPIQGLKTAQLATTDLNQVKDALQTIKAHGTDFWVVDGNLTATVDDIEMLARWFKPDLVLIDGAYMLGHMTERDIYRRVAINANDIKKKLTAIAPTVASYQFARKANEKKKDESVTIDDIGYSDVIGQVSSIVLGLFQEECPETEQQRLYRVLKGRSGEQGEFSTRWNFENMDFDQVMTDFDQLQFV